jgi:hypothetical protein
MMLPVSMSRMLQATNALPEISGSTPITCPGRTLYGCPMYVCEALQTGCEARQPLLDNLLRRRFVTKDSEPCRPIRGHTRRIIVDCLRARSHSWIVGTAVCAMLLPDDLDFTALFHGVDERVPVSVLHFGVHVLENS